MWKDAISVVDESGRAGPNPVAQGCDSPRESMELMYVEASGSPSQGSPCHALAAKLTQDHLVGRIAGENSRVWGDTSAHSTKVTGLDTASS